MGNDGHILTKGQVQSEFYDALLNKVNWTPMGEGEFSSLHDAKRFYFYAIKPFDEFLVPSAKAACMHSSLALHE